jgi:hypothetical protein
MLKASGLAEGKLTSLTEEAIRSEGDNNYGLELQVRRLPLH